MREIIRLLKLKITKKNILCKYNRWYNSGEPKETRIWAFVPVIAAWISITMRSDPYALCAIHSVVVAWPSSPVGGAPQKGARYARPSSTIFTLTIVGSAACASWRCLSLACFWISRFCVDVHSWSKRVRAVFSTQILLVSAQSYSAVSLDIVSRSCTGDLPGYLSSSSTRPSPFTQLFQPIHCWMDDMVNIWRVLCRSLYRTAQTRHW